MGRGLPVNNSDGVHLPRRNNGFSVFKVAMEPPERLGYEHRPDRHAYSPQGPGAA
jgi:hypothetical protein